MICISIRVIFFEGIVIKLSMVGKGLAVAQGNQVDRELVGKGK
jgi:hypothetical protein